MSPSDNAGLPAKQRGRFVKRERIGPPDCPILDRWTLLNLGFAKLLLHHFLPFADDRAVHDHPRPFLTLVLAGSYRDMVPCDDYCQDLHLGDRMRRGMLRYRPARHRHRARVGPNGCWTLVLMGPLQREWGFWQDGKWYPWRTFERLFGHGMRCGDE